jgi:hypothetical protein
VLLCAALTGILYLQRYWRRLDAAGMAAYAPAGAKAVAFIDVAALRKAGVLELIAGSRAVEESEYQRFVRETQFDYRTDLDAVLLAFLDGENYYLAAGRIRWSPLRDYISQTGGACWNAFCTTQSAQPGRFLSFLPLRRDLLAVALSRNRFAAQHLAQAPRFKPQQALPPDPVWVWLSEEALRSPEVYPPGTQLFIKALQGSGGVTLALGADGTRFRARMLVTCRSDRDAEILVAQFERITDVLRKMLSSSGLQPNPRDLSGVLTAGVFQRKGAEVSGEWPMERAFLEALSGGSY